MMIPTVQKFGNKIECIAYCSGVISLVQRTQNCTKQTIELDCYYELPSGERIHTIIIVPLNELITITELYELSALRQTGQLTYTSELPHTSA